MKTDFQDRIDEYILGRMSDEENAQFEAEVNQDESKREQLEFTRNVKAAISSREDKLAKLKMMQMMYDRKQKLVAASMRATGTDDCHYSPSPQYIEKKKPSRRIGWWAWASGIAAVLVICLFIIGPDSYNSTPSGIIRGECDDVFEIDTVTIPDSIIVDSVSWTNAYE